MAILVFELKHGLTVGKGADAETHYEVELRELTTADVIDSELAAEKVVVVGANGSEKGIAYTSGVIMGLELLRRQVARIGEIDGPVSMKLLRQLHPDDMKMLNDKADEMDKALAGIGNRGRSDAVGENANGVTD
jgi:phage FluMu protein gp41